MGEPKALITIDLSKCQPCTGQICIGVCPQGALEEGKNRKPQIIDVVQCTSCGVCINLCPTKAISLNANTAQK